MGAVFLRPRRFAHAELVCRVKGSLTERYETIKELGAGAQGVTFLVKRKSGDDATRLVAKQTHDMTADGRKIFIREFKRMRELQHPHCIKVIELVESDAQIYVISEYAAGSDLFHYMKHLIDRKASITEEWVAGVFQQAMRGVAYLHEKGIVHNDLKPDNILVMEEYNPHQPDRVPWVAINDFGCATSSSDCGFSSGDPRYQSPETWRILQLLLEDRANPATMKKVGPKADIWSMGTTLYELLSGGLIPFLYEPCSLNHILENASAWLRLKDALLDEEIQIRPYCAGASLEVEDLLCKMFSKDPTERLSAVGVLQHDWFSMKGRNPIDESILKKLEFNETMGLGHTILLNALATKLKHDHYRDCWKVFQEVDTSMGGTITYEEFEPAFIRMGRNAIEAEEVFRAADIDQDGKLSFTEFLAVTFDWDSLEPDVLDQSIKHLFEHIDANRSGQVSKDELDSMFQGTVEQPELQEIHQHIDTNGDGQISFDELKAFLLRRTSRTQLHRYSMKTRSKTRSQSAFSVWLPGRWPTGGCFAACPVLLGNLRLTQS